METASYRLFLRSLADQIGNVVCRVFPELHFPGNIVFLQYFFNVRNDVRTLALHFAIAPTFKPANLNIRTPAPGAVVPSSRVPDSIPCRAAFERRTVLTIRPMGSPKTHLFAYLLHIFCISNS
jgi:hypothetical protein